MTTSGRCCAVIPSRPRCCRTRSRTAALFPNHYALAVVAGVRPLTRVDGDVVASRCTFGSFQAATSPPSCWAKIVVSARGQCLGRGGGVEVELDHLPVALVPVVPVVVCPVEPVLQGELARGSGVGGDPGVHGGRGRERRRPAAVVAAGLQWLAGQVEVRAFAVPGEVGGHRRRLRRAVGQSQGHVGSPEDGVDRDRRVVLALAAPRGYPADHDRCEPLGQLLLGVPATARWVLRVPAASSARPVPPRPSRRR